MLTAKTFSKKRKLSAAIGHSVASSAGATSCASGQLAFACGSVVVIEHGGINFLLGRCVSAVALSPCGTWIAIGERGNQPRVAVFVVESGDMIFESTKHQHGVSALAWSPCGQYLASCGFLNDGFLFVYDGKEAWAVAHTAKVSTKVFSLVWEDSQTFWSGGQKLKQWTLNSATKGLLSKSVLLGDKQECFMQLAHVEGAGVFAVTLSGLLCGVTEFKVDRWVTLGVAMHSIAAIDGLLFCAGAQGAVHVFAAVSMEHVFSLPVSDNAPSVLSIVPQGVSAVHCFLADGSRLVYDLTLRSVVREVFGHTGTVWSVDASQSATSMPEGAFASAGADGSVRVWSRDGAELSRMQVGGPTEASMLELGPSVVPSLPDLESGRPRGQRGVRVVRFSNDGSRIACGSRDGTLRIYNSNSAECVFERKLHESDILDLAYSRPTDPAEPVYLATAARDRSVQIIEDNERVVRRLEDHAGAVTAVRFLSGQRLLSAGADKAVVLQTLGSANMKKDRIVGHGSLADLGSDAKGEIFVTMGQDRKLTVYDSESGKVLRALTTRLPSEMTHAAVDAGGVYLFASTKKQLDIIDLATGEVVASRPLLESVTGLTLTTPDTRLIMSTSEGVILVFELDKQITERITASAAKISPSVSHSNDAKVSSKIDVSPMTPVRSVAPTMEMSPAFPSWLNASSPLPSSAGDVTSASPLPWQRTGAGEAQSPFLFAGASNDFILAPTGTASKLPPPSTLKKSTIVMATKEASIEDCTSPVRVEKLIFDDETSVFSPLIQSEPVVSVIAFAELIEESVSTLRLTMEHQSTTVSVSRATMESEVQSVQIVAAEPKKKSVFETEVERTRARLEAMGMMPSGTGAAKKQHHRPLAAKKQENVAPSAQSGSVSTKDVATRLQSVIDEAKAMYVGLSEHDPMRLILETSFATVPGFAGRSEMLEQYSEQLMALVEKKLTHTN